jgi:hypothetical protein
LASWIEGLVYDSSTGDGITTAEVTIGNLSLNTVLEGRYLSMILPGTYSIGVSASGYESIASEVEITEGTTVTRDFGMVPAGTGDGNGEDDGGAPAPTPAPSGGGGGGCFIATAAYRSPMEPHGTILSSFRDRYLFSCQVGRMLVNVYAKYSQPVADSIAEYYIFTTVLRFGLLPLVAFCYALVHFGYTIVVTAVVLVFLLPIILVRFSRGEHSTLRK